MIIKVFQRFVFCSIGRSVMVSVRAQIRNSVWSKLFFSADDGKCLSLQRFLKRLLYCNKLICWFRDWQSPKIFVFNFPVRSLASSLATICWQRQLPCHYWVYQVALNLNWTAELGLSSVKIHLNFDLCLKRRLAVLRQSLDVDFKLNRMRVGIMISNCQQIWPL